jgi:hypothetical protein
MSSPFTEIFANSLNVTFFFAQNAVISRFVPGSCPPKLFAGNARISRPFVLYVL